MMKKTVFSIMIASAMSLSAHSQQCDQLVWSDEFDGTSLNLDNWGFDLGDGCPELCGWGNAELQYYTDQPENIFVQDGALHIRAQYDEFAQYPHTSARIVTRDHHVFKSGKIEARIKMPEGQGFWPAFWMLPEDTEYGVWPLSGEIDITEVVGGNPFENHGTIHYGAKWPFNLYTGNVVALNQSLADDFHTYAVEWDENEIRWYLDGNQFSVKTKADLGTFPWPFDQDFHIIMNLAVGGWFPGWPDDTTVYPGELTVDYVRVYQRPDLAIISGENYAFQGDPLSYRTTNLENTSYNWTVNGGEITSGQGTEEVEVVWNEAGTGTISVSIDNGVCPATVSQNVKVGDECSLLLSDFENENGVHWSWVQGSYGFDPTPSPNTVNPSATAGRWTREGESSDRIQFTIQGIEDATPFGNEERAFAVKTFSNAPAGTLLEIRLQNEGQTGGSITGGTYMTYQATTTVSYEWEQLYFEPVSFPNPQVAPTDINQMQLRMLSTQQLGYVVYMDDISIIDVDCIPSSVEEIAAQIEGSLIVDENLLTLQNSNAERIEVYSVNGKRIAGERINGSNWSVVLPASGVYVVKLYGADNVRVEKILMP